MNNAEDILMILIFIAGLVLLGYVGVCVFLYAKQEWLLFRPTKLASDHVFVFEHDFEEYNIEVGEGIALNALLFHADQARGVVYYLHGNAGSLNGWGHQANDFLENGYDFLVVDYRGYGKSCNFTTMYSRSMSGLRSDTGKTGLSSSVSQ